MSLQNQLSLLILLTTLSHTTHTTSPNIYESLAQHYLPSFPVTKTTRSVSVAPSNKQESPNLTTPKLDDYQQHKLALSILSQLPASSTDVISKNTWKDLELYCGGQNPSAHMLERVNRTKTLFGESVLASWIGQGTHSLPIILDRQKATQTLLSNPALAADIDKILNSVKKSQELFLSYWQPEDPINTKFFNRLYYNNKLDLLNHNTLALETGVRLGNLQTTLGCTSMPLTILGEIAWFIYVENKRSDHGISFTEALKKAIPVMWNGLSFKRKMFPPNGNPNPQATMTLADLSYAMEKELGANGKKIMAGGAAFMFGAYGVAIKQALELAKVNKDTANFLQTRLISVASVLQAIKDLCLLVEKNPELGDHMQSTITKLHFEQSSAKLKKLVDILSTNTFQGNASFFSVTGRVLAAHKLMSEIRDELAVALEGLGEVDAHLSITKLLKEFQDKRVGYSFVNFVNKDTPYIELKSFWNPLVDPEIVVTNDASLGKDNGAQNIIITGPNTGGKSTVLKGITMNIMLAQSLGIAPAQQATLTLFSKISTYLNITDDLAAGNSLFKAEVLRAKELIRTVQELKNKEFAFTIMDEVFSGTSPVEGEQAAYHYAKSLSKYDNSLCIIATHFPKLTELEQDMHGVYKNFQIKVTKNPDGSFTRPFKLEHGKSTLNIAFDLLKEEAVF